MDKKGKLNKKTLIILTGLFIVILVVIFVIILCINNSTGKNESKGSEETTTLEAVPTSYYSGYILSANEEWIAEYTDGNITACVYNYDKSGLMDDNASYACSTGTDCCSGDMSTEYSFPGGTALGGGLDATGMMA